METVGCFVAFVFSCAAIGGLIWLTVRVHAIRGLARRVAALELEIAALRTQQSTASVVQATAPAARPADRQRDSQHRAEDLSDRGAVPVPPTTTGAAPAPAASAFPSDPLRRSEPAAPTHAEPTDGDVQEEGGGAEASEPEAASASPPRMPPPEATPPDGPPPRRIDWEQWIGVRGAALVGGIAFALAGIYLVKLGIDQGMLSPTVRVTLGFVSGVALIVGGGIVRQRGAGYPFAANALAGAGLVCLFAATWAARNLYALIGDGVAVGLLLLSTLCGGVLSLRHQSRVIATLGLIGGFATPLLTGSSADRPVQLFTYLLLLNAGVLWVAGKRGWSMLPLLGLAATVVYQGAWIFGAMQNRFGLGLLVVASFPALFLAARSLRRRKEATAGGKAQLTRADTALDGVALLTPFLFGLYFARAADLGNASLPLFAVVLFLATAATGAARLHATPALAFGGVTASLGIAAAWLSRLSTDPGEEPSSIAVRWGAAAAAVVLVAAQALWFVYRRRRSLDATLEGRATVVLGTGLILLLTVSTWAQPVLHFIPVLLAACALGVVLIALRRAVPFAELLAGGGVGLLLAVALLRSANTARPGDLPAWLLGAIGLLIATGLLIWAHRAQDFPSSSGGSEQRGSLALRAAATVVLLSVLQLLALTGFETGQLELLVLASLLAIPGALAATNLGAGVLWASLVGATTLAHWALYEIGSSAASLALLVATLTAWTLWPAFVARQQFSRSRVAHYVAILVPWLWLWPVLELWQDRLKWPCVAAVPLGFGALSLVLLRRLIGDRDSTTAVTARIAWCAASSLSFVALAIPLQLDREWITVGWSLQAVAVLLIWRRIDHPGLKFFAALLAGACFLRLVANPAVLHYHPAHAPLGLPVLNWLLYGYLVPAGAFLAARRILLPLEVSRLRPREAPIYAIGGGPVPRLAQLLGGAVVLIGFVWLNLTVLDAFATERALQIRLDRLPLRDVSLSLTWGAYGLSLLVLGLVRGGRALRWASLAVLLATLTKVFFYDLGELRGLFRVFSLLGVAAALIGVSLLYQKFVFRRPAESTPPPHADHE